MWRIRRGGDTILPGPPRRLRRSGPAAEAQVVRWRAAQSRSVPLARQQPHCGWWTPSRAVSRSRGSPPPTGQPPRASPGSPPRPSRRPCRAAPRAPGRGVPLRPLAWCRLPRRIQVSREPRVSTIAEGAARRGPRTSGQAARQPDAAARPPPNPRLLLAGRERGGSRAVKFSSGTRGCRRTPRSRSAGR